MTMYENLVGIFTIKTDVIAGWLEGDSVVIVEYDDYYILKRKSSSLSISRETFDNYVERGWLVNTKDSGVAHA